MEKLRIKVQFLEGTAGFSLL